MALRIDAADARKYAVGLKGLGVDCVDDLYSLEADDVEEIEMKKLHRRKVLKKIADGGES